MLNTLFDSPALPDWAKQYSNVLNPSSFLGSQDAGAGSATIGSGTGEDIYSGFGGDLFDNFGVGTDQTRRLNLDRLQQFMGDNQLREAYGPDNQLARWMQDASGNVSGPVDIRSLTDRNFDAGVGLASLVTGANMGAFNGLMGGATSSTPGATTPALLESAIGTPGYGASSAGLGGGPGVLANLTAPSAVDYSLATAPNAMTGGALGGTSNGVLGGSGAGMTAGIGEGLTLAAPTGTGAGITGTGTAANIIGSGIGSSLPAVGESLLPPSQQMVPGVQPKGQFANPTTPGAPTSPGTPGGSGGSNVNMGSVLGNLFGMITANQDRKDYNDLMAKMEGLYTPDSAYSQQMRDELERRDSAAGRGSQYGPRAVELAAKLTDSKARALSNMTMPLSASMMSRNMVASNLNNLFTGGGNPNVSDIFDAGSEVVDWGKGAFDWFNKQFPDLFGG